MKVNFKYAFMAIVALSMGLTSCSKDDDATVVEGKDTYMKVSVLFPSNSTESRATGDANSTDGEAEVHTVDVFIYNDAGTYLSRTSLTASDFTQGTSTSTADVYEASTKIKTTTGAKKVLVGINLPSEVLTAIENKHISAASDEAYSLTRANLSAVDTKGLPMFSTATTSSTFVADENDAANNLSINVKRMVAKVTVEQSASMTQGGIDGELGTLEFAINNLNEKSYLLQGVAPEYKDPNWASGSYFQGDFSNADLGASSPDWKTIVTEVTEIKTLVANYATENTSEDKTKGEITRVTVRATFMPNAITVYENGTDNSGGYITVDRATDLSITAPQEFYAVTPSVTLPTAFFYDNDVATSYATDNGGEVITYTGGFCYWNIFLNKTDNTGKQWDVVRNEFFRCRVTGVIVPGNNTPDVDPDAKPDEDTNIFTDINILFWNTPVLADYVLEP